MIRYLNILLFGGMIAMNYLANALPLNNKTTGQLSDSYPNLFVPAGVTFSIWGIIYLLIAVYCILQFTMANQALVQRIGWYLAFSCVFNALWIVFWHYEKLPFSLIVMVALLITLIIINKLLRNTPTGISKATFGIYLGWICIALIANVTALLVRYGWTGFGISDEIWAIVMILAGAGIASLAIVAFKNPFIGLSVTWAFTGIILKRHSDYRSIVIACAAAMLVVVLVMIWQFFSRNTDNLLAFKTA